MEMSNWSFAMNERCYENDYIRARAHILSHSQYHHGLLLSLSRFIDDEFSILILSFGALASRFPEDSLCIGAVFCECWICMYTRCVRRCILFYTFNVQCACPRTLFNRSMYIVQCSVFTFDHIIAAIIVSHLICAAPFFRFACTKSNVLARKRVVVWTKRKKRNEQ